MAWVFIDMIKTDTLDAATQAAARVNDPRLTAFHDPSHRVGRAMARRLGWKRHVAWDTYFIYGPAVHWTGEEMPVPDFWWHQLQDREVWERTAEAEFGNAEWTQALAKKSEADPAHFATGDALRVALAEGVTNANSTPVATG
jgi:uncharacterized membrane-anchored protein